MAAVYAYNVLTNRDPQSTKYIERYADLCLHPQPSGRPRRRCLRLRHPVRAQSLPALRSTDEGSGKGPEG